MVSDRVLAPERYRIAMPRSNPIEKLRKICLALPDATEKVAWGEPTWRVGRKMFAMFDNNHHDAGHIAVWCKAPIGFQSMMVEQAPRRFFVPPYVGVNGWVGVRLDLDVDWNEIASVVNQAYRMASEKPSRTARTIESKSAKAARR